MNLATYYGVSEKTAQRDIDDLRAYLVEEHQLEFEIAIKYDRQKQGYYLVRFDREWLTNEEVLAMCKILLESRAFRKDELKQLITKLLAQVVPKDRKVVDDLIRNEFNCYVALRHGQKLFLRLWELSQNITAHKIISFNYKRTDGEKKNHRVKPVAIMFSEYYFYLIAFMADDSKVYPTVFRIDRMSLIKETDEKFIMPYMKQFSDGEFRKRVQFMYSGELKHVTFEFTGISIEAVLDRLPTAKILSEKQGCYTIAAETYGEGLMMWLRSQGDWVKIIN